MAKYSSKKSLSREGVETITAKTGAPIVLDSSVAWFDCEVLDFSDVGSHYLIIAEVVDGDVFSNEEALTYDYYHAKYKMRSPKNAPTYIEKETIYTNTGNWNPNNWSKL